MTYGQVIEQGQEISSSEMLEYLDKCQNHKGDFQISIKNEPDGYLSYIFSGTSNDEDYFKYDSDSGAWMMSQGNFDYYYLNNGKHGVKSYRELDTYITNWVKKDRVDDFLETSEQYMLVNIQDIESIKNMLGGEKQYKVTVQKREIYIL